MPCSRPCRNLAPPPMPPDSTVMFLITSVVVRSGVALLESTGGELCLKAGTIVLLGCV